MKKTAFFFLFIVGLAYSQRTGHSYNTIVSDIYFNDDYSKFISRNGNEIGYWDCAAKKPTWVFETKAFGCDYSGNFWYLIPHTNLDYFSMVNYSSCDKLIDVKKLSYSPSYSKQLYWVNEKAYIITAVDEKNNRSVYCYESSAKEKKLIYKGKIENVKYCILKDKIYVSDKNKTKRYDIASEKWDDYSIDIGGINKINEKYVEYLIGNEYYIYDFQTRASKKVDIGSFVMDRYKLKVDQYVMVNIDTKEVFFYDIPSGSQSKIEVKFNYQNKDAAKFVDYDGNKKILYFIENERIVFNNSIRVKSYLSAYSREGNFINSIALTETDAATVAALDKVAYSEAEKRQNEEAARNTPENIMRNRLSRIYNEKYINTTNKRIYQVVPDKPIYEGNLVRLNALHHDKTKTEEVYENIDNLEDPTKYTAVKQFGKCFVCNGQGVTHQNGKQTVADYEYTLGVKVVKTSTKTSGCQHCGGGGIIVKE